MLDFLGMVQYFTHIILFSFCNNGSIFANIGEKFKEISAEMVFFSYMVSMA